jgi:Ca2+/Na+ antiporter
VGAVFDGKTDLAIGNVVGSNIFNVLFILGVSALIAPLVVHSQLIRQEVPIMIGASLLLVVMVLDGKLGRLDAALLAALLAGYMVFLVMQSRAESAEIRDEYAESVCRRGEWDSHWAVQALLIVVGLGLLVLGSGWLVDSSVAFARALGVSDLSSGSRSSPRAHPCPSWRLRSWRRSAGSGTSPLATWSAATRSTSSAVSASRGWSVVTDSASRRPCSISISG